MKHNALICLICLPWIAHAVNAAPEISLRTPRGPSEAQLKRYSTTITERFKLDAKQVLHTLQQAHYNRRVLKTMHHPYEKSYWPRYQKHFLTKKRIKAGAQYWKAHEKTLKYVSNRYGVDPSVIIAIIGIETFYGKHIGNYPVLDALYSLSFYFPQRSDFFKKELGEYLAMTTKQHLNPFTLTGSYAGAMGIPQFMPSSYRHYAVDYTNNQQINLLKNHDDAIASIGNYLYHSHWHRNAPIATMAYVKRPLRSLLLSRKKYHAMTLKDFKKKGISQKHSKKRINPNQKAALIALELSDKKSEYWLIFPNFRAIMTYNPSVNYAMAVYELSQAIKKAHQQ